jgi:hypothetical protein
MSTGRLYKFDSWHDFYKAVQERPRTSGNYNASSDDEQTPRRSWDAGLGLDGALAMAENGWDALRPTISKLSDSITDDLKEMLMDTFRSTYDVCGQTVDIGRYMSGEPENMVTLLPVKESSVGRVVTVLVNGAFNCGVNAVDIQRRGVAICALVECLNLMQHETEIWSEMTISNKGDDITILIKLKGAGDPLDVPELMFAIAHPACLRRVMFRFMETLSIREIRDYGHGYGHPKNLTCSKRVGADIELDQLYGGFDDAEHWVRKQLTQFGLMG